MRLEYIEMSSSQRARIDQYVQKRPASTDFGKAMSYQGAIAMENAAAERAIRHLDARALRRMSLVRLFVKNLDSEEWFRMTSVARDPRAVRSELVKARNGK